MTERTSEISRWLNSKGYIVDDLKPVSGDASFRRYLRGYVDGVSYIIMDAPPANEDCQGFVAIGHALHQAGLNVPEIFQADLENGFLLLSDLGDRQYLGELNQGTAEQLYSDAMDALLVIQKNGPGEGEIPPYDEALLLQEMELFRQWFLGDHLQLKLDKSTNTMLDNTYALLAASALEQPGVCVHRDYHSRNLMLTREHNPGILDFQDAVYGPVTYDLVSLLRDCYIAWPRAQVETWALGFLKHAIQSQIIDGEKIGTQQFLRWFDLMGVQRHLKATGIFARLRHRDGKPGYLNDIPRTLNYIEEVTGCYPELKEFHSFIVQRVKLGLEATILDF